MSVSVDCSHDSARFNWTPSIGVVFYIAVAEDPDGNPHSCFSMGTDCLMGGLTCGQFYNASIIGTNLNCNSTPSEVVTFRTGTPTAPRVSDRPKTPIPVFPPSGPCPPTNIEALRDCDSNRARISWQSRWPSGRHTATLQEANGAQVTCTSNTVSNCNVTSLPCGRKYNVTVAYSDGTCSSTSAPIRMDSGW